YTRFRTNQLLLFLTVLSLAATANTLAQEIYINEIYLDPPGSSGDLLFEYIELRGTQSTSLEDHYLIFLENETGLDGESQGKIDAIVDFNVASSGSIASLGTNGFLTIRQASNFYSAPAAGTTDLVNTGTGLTYGNDGSGPSTVGWSDANNSGRTENSGFTAMIVKVDPDGGSAPILEQDLDVGDNGMFDDVFPSNWTVVDAVGINSDPDEPDGRLYADINFSPGTPPDGGLVEPGATFIDVGFEIEYIGRWGNSTGSTQFDWHASNLTNEGLAGFVGPADFRQSGDLHDGGEDFVESNQGVPYGTELANTLGAPNLFLLNGDFNFDQDVDGDDFLSWQRGVGFGNGDDASRAQGDTHDLATGLLDRVVDGNDLSVWTTLYASAGSIEAPAIAAVPEPLSISMLGLGILTLVAGSQNRRK
ncbi:MAG: hypothetical protein AAGD11_08095, partial [Planctomycetota bacterium]